MDAILATRFAQVRLLAMDVDGVLTDGTFAFDNAGGESRQFHVADGLGIVLLRLQGRDVAWISGRASALVARRARELGVTHLIQGSRDKSAALRCLTEELQLPPYAIAYIGDDWNDLLAFRVAGVKIAVANAVAEVKAAADMVTTHAGGKGAVREVCEILLDAWGERELCLQAYLQSLKAVAHDDQAGQ